MVALILSSWTSKAETQPFQRGKHLTCSSRCVTKLTHFLSKKGIQGGGRNKEGKKKPQHFVSILYEILIIMGNSPVNGLKKKLSFNTF